MSVDIAIFSPRELEVFMAGYADATTDHHAELQQADNYLEQDARAHPAPHRVRTGTPAARARTDRRRPLLPGSVQPPPHGEAGRVPRRARADPLRPLRPQPIHCISALGGRPHLPASSRMTPPHDDERLLGVRGIPEVSLSQEGMKLMSIETRIAVDERDTLVVYDVMREAANHLVAEWRDRAEDRGGRMTQSDVLTEIRAVRDEARQVPTRDYDAIVAATADFRRRCETLAA